jgi:endoglucanase
MIQGVVDRMAQYAAPTEKAEAVSWLARGINIGGVFDHRDREPASWARRDCELAAIVAAGFTSVRLPVRWWGHVNDQPPYELEPSFAEEVDAATAAALSQGLGVVLSMHHADGLMAGERDGLSRLCLIWRQLAQWYRNAPPKLAYDLLNEPRDALTSLRWNELLPVALQAVRELDPTRIVVVGGADASSVAGLLELKLPEDEHLMATIHYYEPFRFTHQQAPWEPGSSSWAGTSWGSPADRKAVTDDLERAASWANLQGVQLYVGEFGTYQAAAQDSREAWTAWVRGELERLDLPWAYWDFNTDFGAYDPQRRRWRDELLNALLSDS